MIENRDAFIQAELEEYRAILWAVEHRTQVLAAEPALALQLVQDGAGVSERAALAALDPDLDLADSDEDRARRIRRAIADDEAWLAGPPDALHPAMARALAPLLADLDRTGGPRFRFEHKPVAPGSNPMVVAYAADGVGTGVWVDAFGDDEDTVDSVSDAMYDASLEASDGNWPACPLHPAAHRAVLYPGGWKCLPTGKHAAELGHLGE